MRHAGALLTLSGQAPDQASSSNRAGAGNHERTGRSKAYLPVIPGVTLAVTNPQPTTIRLRPRSSQSFHRDLARTAPAQLPASGRLT
jgi:hypothetical protein